MTSKAEFFQERVDRFNKKVEGLRAQFNTYSFLRIAGFVLFVVLGIWFISLNNLMAIGILTGVFVIGFVVLIQRHNRIKKDIEHHKKLQEINNEEVKRLKFDFSGISDGGEFSDEKHPYGSDLDVFGRNSLFQLINRAETRDGKIMLKDWLTNLSGKERIETRQQMVSELSQMVEWRQHLQAHGRQRRSKKENEKAFKSWLDQEDFIVDHFFYKIIPYVIIIFSSSLILASLFQFISGFFLFLPFFITGYFLYKIHDYSSQTYNMTDSGIKFLESMEQIILTIEQQDFSDEQLGQLKNQLNTKGLVASQKIKELRKIFELLNLRGNQLYHIFNGFFLLDYIFLAQVEKWRKDYGNEIADWFSTIAEFEALNSIAAFAYANENYTYPKLTDQKYIYKSVNLGHPMIPPWNRVNNDFCLEGRGRSCIITGSNMAGKSTFLRTVGVNAVLAFVGAPVCADSMEISRFQVFSSMRTKDNLEENISSFYAELLRLKMLLEQIEVGQPIFYLLDEILKGTNSVDRHIGAESLIMQLNKTNTFGLVSTHDLALGKLSEQNNLISNFNFSSSIVGEEIVFDYKLHDGICQSTNASQLMAKIGIQIKP